MFNCRFKTFMNRAFLQFAFFTLTLKDKVVQLVTKLSQSNQLPLLNLAPYIVKTSELIVQLKNLVCVRNILERKGRGVIL